MDDRFDIRANWLESIGTLKSRKRYEARLERLTEWLSRRGLTWSTVSADFLEQFQAEQTPVERSLMRSVVNSFFGHLHRQGFRNDDPTQAMAPGRLRPPTLPAEVSEAEVAQFLDDLSAAALSARHKGTRLGLTRTAAVCELAYSSGIIGESLARLKTSDFIPGPEPSMLITANGGEERRVPVTATAAVAISRWLELSYQSFGRKGTVLFHGRDVNTNRRLVSFSFDVQRYRNAARSSNVTMRGLRNAFILHMLNRGFDEEWLTYVLGLKGVTALENLLATLNEREARRD